VLEVPLNIQGYPVLVYDTAGIRAARSRAEREGVRRARLTGDSADLVLWLEDASGRSGDMPDVQAPTLRVLTKVDLLPDWRSSEQLGVSVVSGEGVAELVERLGEAARTSLGIGSGLVTRERQRLAIADAIECLEGIPGAVEEIQADLLRSAGDAIGRLTGRINVEDVLDRLFGEFCIGK
jgi:tRNA modification GTPase